ncbi:LuxR C-terminal-related transcriptional regulator [Allokutzneria albata]|uniref:LuxR C-terminal-related transcriptional regulator n=1 Tax=Allokutzneria albata TaxID=211114 RepID=UPI0038993C91
MGKKLFLAEDTVKTHVHRVLCKLGARTRAHAVAIAFQRGLVSPSGAQSGDGRGYYRHRAGPTEKHTGVSIRALLGGFDYYAGIGPAGGSA